MNDVEFRRPVGKGAILRFEVERASEGKSSVQYAVNVYADDIDTGAEENVFATRVTFVCLDAEGRKRSLTQSG